MVCREKHLKQRLKETVTRTYGVGLWRTPILRQWKPRDRVLKSLESPVSLVRPSERFMYKVT